MKEQLIELRKLLNLSQQAFGEKIKLSKSAISTIEKGTRGITDRTIELVCTQFDVNEEWLRTGEGDIFKKPDNLLELLGFEITSMSDMEIEFLTNFLKLPQDKRKLAISYLQALAGK